MYNIVNTVAIFAPYCCIKLRLFTYILCTNSVQSFKKCCTKLSFMKHARIKLVIMPRPDANGTRLVCLRVTFDRKSRFYNLNLRAADGEWSEDAGRFNKKHENWRADNELLNKHEARAADVLRGFELDGVGFTWSAFESGFDGMDAPGRVLIADAMEVLVQMWEKSEQVANADIYKKVRKFILEYKPRAVLSDLSVGFLEGLEAHLRANRNMSGGGLSLIFRTLRAACRRWYKSDAIRANPFEKHTIGHLKSTRQKKALRRGDIEKLERVEVRGRLERRAWDFFFLSFYLWGMNLADMALIETASIHEGRIRYIRKKTKRPYSVLVSEKAAGILARYNLSGLGYIMPVYTEYHDTERKRRTRRKNLIEDLHPALRVLGERAGVDTSNLTIYSARHSFATILKDSGLPIEQIAALLGHADIRTTANYLLEYKNEVLDEAAAVALLD